jgi:hypothetical protein
VEQNDSAKGELLLRRLMPARSGRAREFECVGGRTQCATAVVASFLGRFDNMTGELDGGERARR